MQLKDGRMLLIDSVYDNLQTFVYLSSDSAPSNSLSSSGLISLSGLSSSMFNIGEFGGKRKARVRESYGRPLSAHIRLGWGRRYSKATARLLQGDSNATPRRLQPRLLQRYCNGTPRRL